MSERPQYRRARAVAELLGLSERTVRRWMADGTLPSVKIGGARLILMDDLLACLGRPIVEDDDGAETEESLN